MCEREGIPALGLSIGLACVTPNADMRPGELVALADLALYKAKDLGRNRTAVAMHPPDEPAAAEPEADHKAA